MSSLQFWKEHPFAAFTGIVSFGCLTFGVFQHDIELLLLAIINLITFYSEIQRISYAQLRDAIAKNITIDTKLLAMDRDIIMFLMNRFVLTDEERKELESHL